jgi:hypothetical protein
MHSAETSTLPRGETRQEIEQFLHHESSVHELRMCGGHGEHWFRTMEGMRTVEGDGASQRWRTRQPCLPSGAASRHGASCMLAHICTIRSAWLGVIYGSRQSMSATQHAQFLTRTHTHPFLLHLTNRPTMLTFIHVFSRIHVPIAETRTSAKVQAPPRCLSGLLARLGVREKLRNWVGLPKKVVPAS